MPSEVYSNGILRHDGFLFIVLSEKVKCKITCCCEFLKYNWKYGWKKNLKLLTNLNHPLQKMSKKMCKE